MHESRKLLVLAAAATLAGANGTLLASTVDWTGLGANGNWSTAENWTGDAVPAATDVARFGPAAVPTSTVPKLTTGTAIDGIVIDNSGGYAWQLAYSSSSAPGALAIGASGVVASGGGVSLVEGATVTLVGAQTWNIGADTTVQTRAIAGDGKLTKTGTGTLLLASTSSATHTGTIDVVAGTLANARGSNGAGATGNLVTIFDGATYESRGASNANVTLLLKDGATVVGSGASSGVGGNIRLDTASNTNLKIKTAVANELFALTSSVKGGAANSIITIEGPGTVALRGTSQGTDATGTYVGSWKVKSGTLSMESYSPTQVPVGMVGEVARPIELAGGTLRLGFNTNATVRLGLNSGGIPGRSAITVTDSSTIIAEQFTTSDYNGVNRPTNNLLTREVGTLAIDGSTLSVTGGRFGNSGSPTSDVTAKVTMQATTLSGTPTFNVYNGTAGSAASLAELELGAVGETGGAHGLIKTGNGLLNLTNAANTYTGPTTVNEGTLRFAVNGAQSTSSIFVAAGATVRMANSAATTTTANLSGSGLITMPNSLTNSLTIKGSSISPGSSAGILTISGAPVELAADGEELASLHIEVVGGNEVVGVDYDRLVIESTLAGLENANLFVDLVGVTEGDMAGDVLTIVTSTSDFTGQSFASVTFSENWSGDVTYGAGSITLSNLALVPEPASIGLAGGLALLLGRRRRSNQD